MTFPLLFLLANDAIKEPASHCDRILIWRIQVICTFQETRVPQTRVLCMSAFKSHAVALPVKSPTRFSYHLSPIT